jgi:predicted transcriptional regulator
MKDFSELKFIRVVNFKNGSYKLYFIENEVYEVLKSIGYRFVRIEREPFIYRIDVKSHISLIRHFQEFRDAFAEYLKQIDLPEKERNEILNTFYAKRPIKRNGLIEYYLTDSSEPSIYLIEEIKRQKRNQ